MNDRIQAWKDSTWQIQPTLDMPALDPEAVQYAVLDSDPIEGFRMSLKQNRERFRKEIGEETDSLQRELLKRVQISGTWDRLFSVVPGDQVCLLVPSRSERNESLMRTTLIRSNGPAGRKWFATKIVYRDNAPMCWCIPVETAMGTSVQVEIRKENVLNITRLYEEIIGAN